MEGIRQERPNEGPILNSDQRLLKKFDTGVKKSMIFQTLKK